MKFKATELQQKPFLYWQGWDGADGPLVLDEKDVPEFIYGVCPLKIENGQLVQLSQAELDQYEAEYLLDQAALAYLQKSQALEKAVFDYGGAQFPMHTAARLYYGIMEKAVSDYDVLQADGQQRTITAAENADFLTAFNAKLISEVQP